MEQATSFIVLSKMVYLAQFKLQEDDLIGAKIVLDYITNEIKAHSHSINQENEPLRAEIVGQVDSVLANIEKLRM